MARKVCIIGAIPTPTAIIVISFIPPPEVKANRANYVRVESISVQESEENNKPVEHATLPFNRSISSYLCIHYVEKERSFYPHTLKCTENSELTPQLAYEYNLMQLLEVYMNDQSL